MQQRILQSSVESPIGSIVVVVAHHLRLLFPHNRDLAYRWMTTRNKAFDNLTPVEVVKEWGFAGLLMVRAYLDRARGA